MPLPIPPLTTEKIISLVVGSAIFYVILLLIGRVTGKWISGMTDYFAGGREVSILLIASVFMGIGFAGSMISAIPALAIGWGFWPTVWYFIPWAAVLGIFGVGVGPLIRRTGIHTIAEWMGQKYGSGSRMAASWATIIGLLGVTAAQYVGLGRILQVLTGWPYWQSTLVAMVIVSLYMYLGGLWAVSVEAFAQLLFGVVGVLGVIFWAGITFGWVDWLALNVPPHVFAPLGSLGTKMLAGFTYTNIPTWLLTWFMLVFGSQYYWIMMASARSDRAAKIGPIIGGVGATIIFAVWMALAGVYAFAIGGPPGPQTWDVRGAYGLLMRFMPPGLDAFLLLAMVAAALTTAGPPIIAMSSVATRDIYCTIKRKRPDEALLAGRIFTVFFSLITWLVAVFWVYGAELMLALGCALLGPLAVTFILGIAIKRVSPGGVMAGIIAGIIGVLIWQFWPSTPPLWVKYAHMSWIALLITAVVTLVVSMFTKPKYFALPTWRPPKPVGFSSTMKIGDDVIEHAKLIDSLAKPVNIFGLADRLEKIRFRSRSPTILEALFPILYRRDKNV